MNKEQTLSRICKLAKDKLVAQHKVCTLQTQIRELLTDMATCRSQILLTHYKYQQDCCEQDQLPDSLLFGNILVEIIGNEEDGEGVCIREFEQMATPLMQ